MEETKSSNFFAKHPTLYHYTNESGLKGIISSNSIWATHFRDLNDSAEIVHLKAPLKTALSKILLKQLKEYRSSGAMERRFVVKNGGAEILAKKLSNGWIDALYATTFEKADDARTGFFGIASFCSHADDQEYERKNGLLSQWRGYGREGGYCLVFDTLALSGLIDREKASNFYLHAELSAAKYLFDAELVAEYFRDLLDLSGEIVKARLVDDQNIGKLGSQSFVPFVSAAATTKHRGFYEEREIRLVAIPATNVADAQIRDKVGYVPMPMKQELALHLRDRQRRYISLFGNDFEKLPLIKVLVGPSREQKANVQLARRIVKDRVPVIASETPYLD